MNQKTFPQARLTNCASSMCNRKTCEFNFCKEILDYCLEDVRVLLSALQVAIKEDIRMMGFDGMAKTCTIAAKTMLYFRNSFLKENTIGVIPQNGYQGYRKQSAEGMFWLLSQEFQFPNLRHALSTQGEKVICGLPVDGFDEASNTVLQFHGCFWHGCPKCCYTDRSFNKK